VPIGTHMFGVCVPMGTSHPSARSIPVENDLLNFFLYFLIKSETHIIDDASPFSKMCDAPS
jgi:hypothetical protein